MKTEPSKIRHGPGSLVGNALVTLKKTEVCVVGCQVRGSGDPLENGGGEVGLLGQFGHNIQSLYKSHAKMFYLYPTPIGQLKEF